MIQFQHASAPKEIHEILRLRYEIYVTEMQVYIAKANHEQRTFTDSLDKTNRLLYASEEGEVVGAISIMLGLDAPFSEEFSEVYDLPRFSKVLPESKMAAAIRLVTKPEHRSTTLPFKLMAEGAKEWVKNGVQLAFCTCQPHLINMYKRLGFQSYSHQTYNDPEFGIMVPLVIVLGDDEHFKAVRSPMRSIFAAGSYDLALLPKIYQAMGKTAVAEIVADEEDEDWAALSKILKAPHAQNVHLLEGLNEEAVKQVIALGQVIDCQQGQQVIKQGQVTQTVFVPLTGSLEVRLKNRLVAVIQTGEMIGELSFLLSNRRTTDVFAGPGGAKVLSLNDRNLRKFIEQPSHIATQLLLNISKSLAHRLAQTTRELG